ncbi:MAG TPA: thiamine pyrophosphate-dependent enzyme [Candidatus Binatia bacterium]|nr:thiamine pyrophosphate-dependent enzyme [Candidatus Binatia bacterium]
MIRFDCFEWLAPQMKDELVVTSLSGQRVEWGHLSQRDADLTLGSMGNALAVGMGLALALPHRKVFVFESDGSLLLSLFNLPTLANLNPPNLAVFVFDNQKYSGTRISYPTATAGKTDLAAVAKGAGVEHSLTIREFEEFKHEATGALRESGLRFVVCKIEESLAHRKIVRSNIDLLETKYKFVRYLERTEGRPIFAGRG